MLEVLQQADGSFAVCELGGQDMNPIAATFDTVEEASSWMLKRSMQLGSIRSGLSILKPGSGQGVS